MFKIDRSQGVPFDRKSLCLKQVKFSDLYEIEKIALGFFAPGYADASGFRKYQPTKASPLHVVAEKGFEFIRDENPARRFALVGLNPSGAATGPTF